MEIVLNKEITRSKLASRVIGISAFVALTALGAFLRVPLPFSPVPLTLQTFFVLLGAAALGKNRGTVVQLSYVFLGAAGLPIFSGAGSGLAYLTGPTAGYLLGFIVASLFIGQVINRVGNKFLVFLVLLGADFLILGLGSLWLKLFLHCSFNKALVLGMIPFIPGDLCKAGLAFLFYQKIKVRCKEIFQ
jgi:biotin transport system substrate-specific component